AGRSRSSWFAGSSRSGAVFKAGLESGEGGESLDRRQPIDIDSPEIVDDATFHRREQAHLLHRTIRPTPMSQTRLACFAILTPFEIGQDFTRADDNRVRKTGKSSNLNSVTARSWLFDHSA